MAQSDFFRRWSLWSGGGVQGGGVPPPPLTVYVHCYASLPYPPPWDIPLRRCFFAGPWTVTRSSLHMLRWGAAFCWPLRPVLLLVSFPRSRSPGVGVPQLALIRLQLMANRCRVADG